MNLKPSTVRTTLVAAMLLVLSVTSASAGRPVPGVDVIVEKNPGGVAVGTVTSDKDGEFEFANLKPGKYLLDYQPSQSINTTRSNIRHQTKMKQEVQEDESLIGFVTGKEGKPFATVALEITAKAGKLTGVVTQAEPAKPGEPKAANPMASKPKAK